MNVCVTRVAPLLRIKEPSLPQRFRRGARKPDTLMQSRVTVDPELDLDRLKPIAAPIVGSRHVGVCEPPLVGFDRRLEVAAMGERPGLRARPGADLAPPGTGREIGVA